MRFLDRAISDMRGFGTGSSLTTFAPNEEPCWGRRENSMKRSAQLTGNRWLGRTQDGNYTDMFLSINPTRGEASYISDTFRKLPYRYDKVTWWNQVYLGEVSRDAFIRNGPGGRSNTRLMAWDPQVWVQYKDTNQWELIWTRRTFGGNAFEPVFRKDSGGWDVNGNWDGNPAVDVRVESTGYISTRIVTGAVNGYTPLDAPYWITHGWAGAAQFFRGGGDNVKNLLSLQYVSLVRHDPGLTDDRDAARYLSAVGLDSLPYGWGPNDPDATSYPSVGSTRHRFIRAKWPQWEVQIMHTMSEAEILAGDFPPQLAGLSENFDGTTGTVPSPSPTPTPTPAPNPTPSPTPSPPPPPPPPAPPPPTAAPVSPGFLPPGDYALLLSNSLGNYVSYPVTVEGAPTLTTQTLPLARRGFPYTTVIAAGGATPVRLRVKSGSLPAGLTLNSETGEIAGTTATEAVTSTFTLEATNGREPAASATFTITVGSGPGIGDEMPSGTVGVPYSAIARPDGDPPFTFQITDGSVPDGLSTRVAVDWEVDLSGDSLRASTLDLTRWGYAPHNLLPDSEVLSDWTLSGASVQRNWLLYSEEFANSGWAKLDSEVLANLCGLSSTYASWSKTNVTVDDNVATSPDGTPTAGRINEGWSTGQRYFSTGPNLSYRVGASYTFSVYARAGTATLMQIVPPSAGFGTTAWATFDLVAGTVPNKGAGASAAWVEDAGNGWWRCCLTAAATATTSTATAQFGFCEATITGTRLPSYEGKGRHYFLWGAQTVLGTDPLVLRETTGATALAIQYPGPVAGMVANRVEPIAGTFTYGGPRRTVSIALGRKYAFTVYIKAAGAGWAHLTVYENNGRCLVNLTDGTVQAWNGDGDPVSATSQDAGSGWWRVTFTFTARNTSSTNFQIGPRSTGGDPSTSVAHTALHGILVSGAQVVDGGDAGVYTRSDAAAAVVGYADPFGGNSAWMMVPHVGPAVHYVGRSITSTTLPVTCSVYARKPPTSAIYRASIEVASGEVASFNLSDGTAAPQSRCLSATAVPVGGGWYRLTAQINASAAKTYFRVYASSSATLGHASTTENGLDGMLFCRPQMSFGLRALDYVPNTGNSAVGPTEPGWLVTGTAAARLIASVRSSDAMQQRADDEWEEALHNAIPNSTMAGAVAGSPGSVPTGWNVPDTNVGLSRSVSTVGVDPATGMLYIDIRHSGIASGSAAIIMWTQTLGQATVPNEVWTHDVYLQWIGAGRPNASTLRLGYYQAGGSSNAQTDLVITNLVSASALTRLSVTGSGGTNTAFVAPQLRFGVTVGQSYDFTMRVMMPQMYRGPYRAALVPTINAAVYAPAIDHDPVANDYVLRVEEARTNHVRNSAVIGSTNALPSPWNTVSSTGLTFAYTTGVTLDGLPALDVRVTGTSSATNPHQLVFESATTIIAAQGETWTGSFFAKLVAGSLGDIVPGIAIVERLADGTFVSSGTATITLDGTVRRPSMTRTLGSATTARVNHELRFTPTIGQTYDFTFRVACPQLEQGAWASSPILTWGSASATRAVDLPIIRDTAAGWIGQDQGTMLVEAVTAPGIGSSGQYAASLQGAGTDECIIPQRNTSRQIGTTFVDGNVGQWGTNAILGTVADSTFYRHALSYRVNDLAHSLDGGAAIGDTSATIPTMTQLVLGATHSGSSPWNGGIRRLRYRRLRLPNETLVALSGGGAPIHGDGVEVYGTPTAAMFRSFNIRATNDFGTDTDLQSITINHPPYQTGAVPGGWGRFLRQ